MWVDIANLIGPRGQDGQDGEQGPQGPVNVGLNPNEPIVWDQQGGITFNLVDGSQQTVNLPIASAQSAGLLGASGQLPSTGLQNITSLLSEKVSSGTARLIRVGPMVTLFLQRLQFNGSTTGYSQLMQLPTGFRPLTEIRDNYAIPSNSALITVFVDGTISTNQGLGEQLSRTFTFPTSNPWPAS